MGAGGDFRHDAAEGGMVGDLGEHDIGEDAAGAVVVARDHGGRGLVATGLDAENDHPPNPPEIGYFAPRMSAGKIGQ